MDEIIILKEKLNLIINKYHNDKNIDVDEFEKLLKKLSEIEKKSIAVQNNSLFSRILNSIRMKIFKPKEAKFDTEQYIEIRNKAIQMYNDQILKKEYPIVIEQNNFTDPYFENPYGINPHEKFLEEIRKYQIIKTRLKEKEDGKIEVYPWKVKEEDLKLTADREYLKVSEKFLTTPRSIDKSFNDSRLDLIDEHKAVKDNFMQKQLEPYYGSPEFIYQRSYYIVQCMEKILSEKEVKTQNKIVTKQLIGDAKIILGEIEKNKESLSITQDENKYENIRANFEKLLTFEDMISNDVEEIWNEFLTKPEEYKQGNRFAFLVHAYTNGFAKIDQMNKCCCTLVTEKCMPIIGENNFGIICDFKSANVSAMCTEDAGSWVINKEKFFDCEIPIGWQFAEKAGNENDRVYYETPKVSKLILPTTMEKEMIEKNLKVKNDRKDIEYKGYTEVFMVKGKNNEEIPMQAMFYTDENGKEKAEKTKGKYLSLMIDPSLGTVVPFSNRNNKTNAKGENEIG